MKRYFSKDNKQMANKHVKWNIKKAKLENSLVVQWLVLPELSLPRAQVRSLVRELRSYLLYSWRKKRKQTKLKPRTGTTTCLRWLKVKNPPCKTGEGTERQECSFTISGNTNDTDILQNHLTISCRVKGASLVAQMVKKKKDKICLDCRRYRFNPWVRKIPWRREQGWTQAYHMTEKPHS